MKKLSYFALAATAILCACDPIEEGGTFDPVAVSQDVLNNGSFITFTQKDANGNPAADGNFITYTTNPATTITVSQRKGDANVILAVGPTGSFKLAPGRGSDPNQELVISVANSDRTFTETTRIVNVYVKQDLDPEYKLLLGEKGKKSWAFTDDDIRWGNAGNTGNGAAFTRDNVDGRWWGVGTAEEFADQMGHAQGDETLGALDAAEGSYMTFDEDFNIASFTADGDAIRKGSYEIVDYDPSRPSGWQIGTLKTSVPAVLWPYSINENGKQVTEFDIMYLDGNHMTLVYTKGNGAGSWGEITFWCFKSDDPQSFAAGSKPEGKKWAWNTDGWNGGIVWGNMGYCGGDGTKVYTNSEGRWWGVGTTGEFADQTSHRGPDTITGDEDVEGAYMIITEKEIQSFDKDGKMIRNGEYSFDTSVKNDWKKADLNINSTNGAILWPYEINSGGNMPSTYEVVYISDDAMSLVYPDGGAFSSLGGWGEATFWHFKAVKE